MNQRPIYKLGGEGYYYEIFVFFKILTIFYIGPSLIAVTDVIIKRSDRKKYAHYAKFVTENEK